jgi:hypothetical protein
MRVLLGTPLGDRTESHLAALTHIRSRDMVGVLASTARRDPYAWRLRVVSRVLLVLLVFALTRCGSEATQGRRLTVSVHPEGAGGLEHTSEISCEAHPRGDACQRLHALTPTELAPVPDGVACTALYGGPAIAHVTGQLEDEQVDARFSLHNGCEIARWGRLAWLLGAPPVR